MIDVDWCGVINLVLAIEVFHVCDWKCLVVLLLERLSWFSTSFMICCLKDIHDFGCGFTSLEVL